MPIPQIKQDKSPQVLIHKLIQNKVGKALVTSNDIAVEDGGIW